MNATKRKFNALLNGMGNKSTGTLTPTNTSPRTDTNSKADIESQKRRRISDSLPSTDREILKPRVTAATRLSSVINHKKSTSLATAASSQEAPKYAPWDRAAFLKRLKTFSNLTDWTPKPAKVNEVEWAKRGWVCQKSERVRCCLCNKEILVKLNRKEVEGKEEPVYVAENIEQAIADKYAELIVTAHNEDCLWRKRGCDDSIFKLSLHNPPTTFHHLRERYDELCTRKANLPYNFNLRTPSNFALDSILKQLPKDFFSSSDGESSANGTTADVDDVALTMALFGWQGHKHDRLGTQLGSVSCDACFRVLGLWLFKSKEVNEAGDEVVAAAVSSLDVVQEHREYCPWRSAASQNGQSSKSHSKSAQLAGWEVLLRVIKNDFYLRTNSERPASSAAEPTPREEQGDPFQDIVDDDEDAQSIREENDKKRWARLRRVKSLFDTKGSKRPGSKSHLSDH